MYLLDAYLSVPYLTGLGLQQLQPAGVEPVRLQLSVPYLTGLGLQPRYSNGVMQTSRTFSSLSDGIGSATEAVRAAHVDVVDFQFPI